MYSKECSLYSSLGVGYSAEAVNTLNCHSQTSSSKLKFFTFKQVEEGETFDCADVQEGRGELLDRHFQQRRKEVDFQALLYTVENNKGFELKTKGRLEQKTINA